MASSTLAQLVSNKSSPIIGSSSMSFFHSCPSGKSSKLPFHLSDSIVSSPVELIHSDVWCSPILSIKGSPRKQTTNKPLEKEEKRERKKEESHLPKFSAEEKKSFQKP